jgi:hypothetical protein
MMFSSKNGSTQVHITAFNWFWFDEIDGLYTSDGLILTSIFDEVPLEFFLDAVWRGDVSVVIKWRREKVIGYEGSIDIKGHKYRKRQLVSTAALLLSADRTENIDYEAYQAVG